MSTIINDIFKMFEYDFMIRSFIVGGLIGITCSFLGVFLILKKQAMIGDGLAHVCFASIAISILLKQQPVLLSLPLVIISSFIIMKLSEKAGVNSDAAIGMVSSFSVSLGVLITSVAKGFNVDLMSYLFGSILLIQKEDIIYSLLLAFIVIGTVIFFYNQLFAITYDEEFAKVKKINTKFYNYIIAILTSITIVLGIRIVGTMLISAMIIYPTVTALQISKSFKQTILISSIISLLCIFLGITSSYLLNFPTGATIVMFNSIMFILMFLLRKLIN